MNERLLRVVEDVLEIRSADEAGAAIRDEHPEWDSLAHLRLVTAIEQEFGIRFTMAEVEGITTLGEFDELVTERAGSA